MNEKRVMIINAEIIAVGTEIIIGQILNSNTKYLSERLADLGIDVFFHTSVGDNINRIVDAIRIASERSNIVIMTGGLGPTADDLTKEALAQFLNLPLEIIPEEVEKLKAHLASRKITMLPSHNKQAAFLPGSNVLNNEYGTAPGMAIKQSGCGYIVLPGPPREMEPMFLNYAVPWITENLLGAGYHKLFSKLLKFGGITESRLEDALKDLIDKQTAPTLATYVGVGEVHLRISAKAADEAGFYEIIKPVLDEVYNRVGTYIVAEDNATVIQRLMQILKERKLSLSTAESCTAGLLSASFTEIPGSSEFYRGSIIAYSNDLKEKLLQVPATILQEHGAVSEQTALAMASAIRKITGTDIGIATTGIAGPDGGSAEKPVGLVYIALSTPEKEIVESNYYKGKREYIRGISVKAAQLLLFKYLKEV